MSTKKQSLQKDNRKIVFPELTAFTGKLHHFYIISTSATKDVAHALKNVLSNREQEGKKQDVRLLSYESFLVEDGVALKSEATEVIGSDEERHFILQFSASTREAQNALLKTVEEPTEGVHFFIVVPNEHLLLDTIRSRAQHVHIVGESIDIRFAETFVDAKLGERLKMIAALISESKDDETSGPGRERATAFLSQLEVVLSRSSVLENKEALAVILKTKEYLALQGAMVKMLLEHVALVV